MIEVISSALFFSGLILYFYSLVKGVYLTRRENNFYRNQQKMIDEAQKKISQMYIESIKKSQELIKDTSIAKEKVEDWSNMLTQKFLEDAEKKYEKILTDFQQKLTKNAIESLNKSNLSLESQLLSMEKQLILEKSNLYDGARQEIEKYKLEKVKQIDSLVAKVLEKVSQKALSESLTYKTQEDYILSCIDNFLEELTKNE